VIELKSITRSYREGAGQTFVLRNINLTIREGEFISIMGPSAAAVQEHEQLRAQGACGRYA
jgi:putative ABC transport system ATP-binding protein